MYKFLAASLYALSVFAFDALPDVPNVWYLLDRYGFPMAALTVALWFIWNRQKKADDDRNALMVQNNLLVQQLIDEVRKGNVCQFTDKTYKETK